MNDIDWAALQDRKVQRERELLARFEREGLGAARSAQEKMPMLADKISLLPRRVAEAVKAMADRLDRALRTESHNPLMARIMAAESLGFIQASFDRYPAAA